MSERSRSDSGFGQSVDRLRGEFDRWLEVARSQGGRALDMFGLRGDHGAYPPIDLVETPDEFLVYADLPGLEPGAVEVTLAGNMLTLRGEKPVTRVEEGHVLHRTERMYGRFSRSIPMAAPVNPEAVSAEAKDGVLSIRLQKMDRARARQIPVQISSGSGPAPGASPPIM